MQTTDTARAAQVAPSITRRAMLGTLAAGAVALALPAQAKRPTPPTPEELATFTDALKQLSPEQLAQAAIVAEAVEQNTPGAWVRAARSLGIAVKQSRADEVKEAGGALYFRDARTGEGTILYDPRQSPEAVCRRLQWGVERHVEGEAKAQTWREAEVLASLRSYRGDDLRLRAASAALKTIEGTARPGELEESLLPFPEAARAEARAIVARAAQ